MVSLAQALPLPAAISGRRGAVLLFRQDSGGRLLFELLRGQSLEIPERVRCLSEPEAFTCRLLAVFCGLILYYESGRDSSCKSWPCLLQGIRKLAGCFPLPILWEQQNTLGILQRGRLRLQREQVR